MAGRDLFDRVLILGAKGMLGQALTQVFADVQPMSWDREDLDITDEHAVRGAVESLKPTLIVNAAAYNAVDEAKTNAETANHVNGEAPGFLAASAKKVRATFVHFSTDYVFDGTKRDGYAETDTPRPMSVYARSKRLGEENVLRQKGQEYLIRTSRLFGKQGSGEGAKESFVDLMLRLSREKGLIEVVDEELSSPTYAPDLARATRNLLEEQKPPGIYHRTNDGTCTWFGFAEEIFRLTGWRGTMQRVPRSRFPQPAARPRFSKLISRKLAPLRPWQNALANFLQTRTL